MKKVTDNTVFTEEQLKLAKQLSYDNWEKEDGIGFVWEGVWVTNPFLEESGRFEFVGYKKMCKHYGKENVDIQIGTRELFEK